MLKIRACDDLVKYGCKFTDMDPYSKKGDALLPWRYAIKRARDTGVASLSIHTKCGNTRIERLTDDYTPCTRVTGFPIRLIAPLDRIHPRWRDDENLYIVAGLTPHRTKIRVLVWITFSVLRIERPHSLISKFWISESVNVRLTYSQIHFFSRLFYVLDYCLMARHLQAIRRAVCHICDPG